MQPPEGLNIEEGKVLKLKKSLYGLKQAPRCWQQKFMTFPAQLDFHPLKYIDDSMYRATIKGENVLMAVYVDDGLIVCKNPKIIENVLEQVKNTFPITTNDPTTMVGMEIYRPKPTGPIILHQKFFVKRSQ